MDCHLLQKRSSEVPELLRTAVGSSYGNVFEAGSASRLLRTCKLMRIGPVSWREHFEYAGLEELEQLPWVGTSECCPFHTAFPNPVGDVKPRQGSFASLALKERGWG